MQMTNLDNCIEFRSAVIGWLIQTINLAFSSQCFGKDIQFTMFGFGKWEELVHKHIDGKTLSKFNKNINKC